MLTGDNMLIPVIGFLLIYMTVTGGIVGLISSVFLQFLRRTSKLPSLILAFAGTALFLIADFLFVLCNFTGGSWTALFDMTVTVFSGGGKFVMEIIIAAVMVLTALSIIYSIFVLIMFIKQKKNKPMEAQNG